MHVSLNTASNIPAAPPHTHTLGYHTHSIVECYMNEIEVCPACALRVRGGQWPAKHVDLIIANYSTSEHSHRQAVSNHVCSVSVCCLYESKVC